MTEAEVLAQLKDIRLPPNPGFWPLAPGWYLVALLALALVLTLAFWVRKKRRQAKPKKEALALFAVYKEQYLKERNSQVTSAKLDELLKRVALVYFPREQVAGLHGQAWIDFLNRESKGLDFSKVAEQLIAFPFKKEQPADLEPLLCMVERWIRQRRGPCSN